MKKLRFLTKTLLVAAGLCVGMSAWADYSSQRVYQDWGRGDNANFNGSALSWSILSGSNGLENASKNETVWNGTSSNYVHTIYNSSAYCPMESVLPTLTYSENYTVSFFFKAKYGTPFQYAIYKKGVTPTSSMLGSADAVFSLTYTSSAGKSEDAGLDMVVSINRSETTVTLKSQTYYKVVLTVNSTNATYNIYPINTSAGTPYIVDTENPVATGTLSSGEMGGLYLNAGSNQTMRFDDIMVDFMPNGKTVKTITATNTTTTNGMNAAGGKYYEKYTISAIDYNDAAIEKSNLTISQTDDTYSDLSDNLLSFKGIGTSTISVNNKSLDVENTVAYLKAACWDLTQRASLVTDNSHELKRNDTYLYGFGVDGNNLERYCWQYYSDKNKRWENSSSAKWILNGFKSTASTSNYWQFHLNYGVNVTNNATLTAQTPIDDMYLKLSLKKNTGETSGDGTAVYAATPTTYSWIKSSSTTFETRDNKVVYTGLDVYIPDGTTVTPTTINGTYNIGTFSYPYALDFSSLSTMTAWKATKTNASTITMEQVTGIVPAGTALILRGTAEAVPIANEPGTTITNLLKPVLDNDESKTVSAATDGTTNFVLSVQSEEVVFAPIDSDPASVPYGRAYLNGIIPGGSRVLTMLFNDETSGVSDVKTKIADVRSEYFDLQGRCVAQPIKGLYIMNGRKVVIK